MVRSRTPSVDAMRALAARLPTQFEEGFRAGLEATGPVTAATRAVFACGMGGSAIAADLGRCLVEAETPVAVTVVRSPALPRTVGRGSTVFLVSHSGNTWETLKAYVAAGRRDARRVVLTSGGTLARRAERDGVPVVTLPSGVQPRTTVGFQMGALLGLLDPAFPESNERRVRVVAERVAAQQRDLLSPRGRAARLASRVAARIPVVVADAPFGALARRWATQVEENAKRVAFFDESPELLHNAIVGWDAVPSRLARDFAVFLLDCATPEPEARRGTAHLGRLLRDHRVVVERVPLAAEDPWETMLGGVSLGDHLSLFLAERAGQDPEPVEAIRRLKAAVARP